MDFNSINFNLSNIANQKAGLVQNKNDLPTGSQAQLQEQFQPKQNMPVQNINPSLMYDLQMAKMDSETVLKYLQNLLNLPNSIEKFVNQLNSKNIDPKLAKILIENMISAKALSEFLNQNSNLAISKLMQTISESLKSGVDAVQLKEMLSFLNVLQANSSLTVNAFKEILLLYIPLNIPVFDKDVDIKGEEIVEDKDEKTLKLSILIETIHFSNFLIVINEMDNIFYIEVHSNDLFEKEEFLRIMNVLSKEAFISTEIYFKNKKDSGIKNEKQNFKVISNGYMSSNMLILSHMIIATILKIDNKNLEM